MIRDMVCIVCPKGCRMRVTLPDDVPPSSESVQVEGNSCKRGEEYARQEMTQPRRVLTTTVRISGAEHTRLPVKTNRGIPKTMLFDVMRALNSVEVKAPVRTGDVIVADILDTEADIVASRDMESAD